MNNKLEKEKKLKSASQMLWIFIGSYLIIGGLTYIIINILKTAGISSYMNLILRITALLGCYYLVIKIMFKNNILYKGELIKLRNQVIVAIVIIGFIPFSFSMFQIIKYRNVVKLFYSKRMIIRSAISQLIGSCVIPSFIYATLLSKFGEESDISKTN